MTQGINKQNTRNKPQMIKIESIQRKGHIKLLKRFYIITIRYKWSWNRFIRFHL